MAMARKRNRNNWVVIPLLCRRSPPLFLPIRQNLCRPFETTIPTFIPCRKPASCSTNLPPTDLPNRRRPQARRAGPWTTSNPPHCFTNHPLPRFSASQSPLSRNASGNTTIGAVGSSRARRLPWWRGRPRHDCASLRTRRRVRGTRPPPATSTAADPAATCLAPPGATTSTVWTTRSERTSLWHSVPPHWKTRTKESRPRR
mmetsp:Transcript_2612/g.6129  ORF Transcript_2612/g.6129 Transcript_2612/m.6129 type:complete len:201 (-) Transcript_2612:785-1387(-)